VGVQRNALCPARIKQKVFLAHQNQTGHSFSFSRLSYVTFAFAPFAFARDFTFDKRIHLIPEARLIITISASNDGLVLRRFSG
jgi:hypothetical protein